MRIGLLLPATFAVGNPANGVLAQAKFQAAALERLGHEVVRLDPWSPAAAGSLDVVHYYVGGYAMHRLHVAARGRHRLTSFSTIIDSNEPNRRYRMAARLGSAHPRFDTVPGVYRQQGLASDLVVVRSRHERERVIEGLGIDPAKVEIVLNGVDPPAAADPERARQELGLPETYALHVSAYNQQRKNVRRLIEAVGPTGLPLVVAGAAVEDAELERIREAAARHANVRLFSYLPAEMLLSLYAGCRVFCLPSEHEGTGLVALEAASYGARVVITANGGPRDYFEDMAEYVVPEDVEGIRRGVERAWGAPESGRLREHVLRNLTWDKSAASLAGAFARRLGDGGGGGR